jgi:hypothetical protein
MLIVGRIEKRRSERARMRKQVLTSKMEEMLKKEEGAVREQEFFTIESLLWPKSEFMLIEAVHSIFKDLKFVISTGVNYQSVDRIVRIPTSQKAFGLVILVSEKALEKGHPKISRALQFQKEKKEGEKTLIIASTHIHLQLAERGRVRHMSKDLADSLSRNQISFLTAYHLHELWQKGKEGIIDIFKVFENIHAHPGGFFSPKHVKTSLPPS